LKAAYDALCCQAVCLAQQVCLVQILHWDYNPPRTGKSCATVLRPGCSPEAIYWRIVGCPDVRAISASPIRVSGAASEASKTSPPQPTASSASELSMAGLMPAGRSRSLGGFDVPKEPMPPKQARLHFPRPYSCTCTQPQFIPCTCPSQVRHAQRAASPPSIRPGAVRCCPCRLATQGLYRAKSRSGGGDHIQPNLFLPLRQGSSSLGPAAPSAPRPVPGMGSHAPRTASGGPLGASPASSEDAMQRRRSLVWGPIVSSLCRKHSSGDNIPSVDSCSCRVSSCKATC